MKVLLTNHDYHTVINTLMRLTADKTKRSSHLEYLPGQFSIAKLEKGAITQQLTDFESRELVSLQA